MLHYEVSLGMDENGPDIINNTYNAYVIKKMEP